MEKSNEKRTNAGWFKNGHLGFRFTGRRHNSCGYIIIYSPNHPLCRHDKTVLEHRLVMEKHIGRLLTPKEVIHHINGVRDDNRIENLKLLKCSRDHSILENRKPYNTDTQRMCSSCKKIKPLSREYFYRQKKPSGVSDFSYLCIPCHLKYGRKRYAEERLIIKKFREMFK